jgi:D-glycero-alpha-D-manno-heptose-7-phosphate kinase
VIITRTPYRLSLFGGGSDYPEWYLKHGGEVLAGAIDKYCYLTLRWLPPFFAHRHRLVYSVVESVNEFREIQHPAVRAALESYSVQRGIELHHDGDLPARSGIGSSAAFAVGLTHALRVLQGLECDPWGLAREAIHLEQDLLGETTGSQDQVICALGGFKHIRFHRSGDITAEGSERMAANITRLQTWLVLLY